MSLSVAPTSFILALHRAFKATRFYEPGHDVVQSLADEAYGTLTDLLHQGTLTIGSVGNALFTADGPADAPSIREAASGVARHLYRRSVIAVCYSPDVSRDDFVAFVRLLAPTPEVVRTGGGARKQWEAAGASCIQIVELNDEPTDADAVVVEAQRQAKGLAGSGNRDTLPAGSDAADLADHLEKLLARAVAPGGTERLALLAVSAFEAVADDAGAVSAEELQSAGKALASAVGAMPQDAALSVLQALSHRDDLGKRIDAFLAVLKHLPNALIADLISSALIEERVPRDDLAQFVRTLQPVDRRLEVLSEIGRRASAGTKLVFDAFQRRVLSAVDLADRQVSIPYGKSLKALRSVVSGSSDLALRDGQPKELAHRAAHAWTLLVRQPEGYAELESVAIRATEALEQAGDEVAALQFAAAASERCNRKNRPDIVASLFEGPEGSRRAERLLHFNLPVQPWLLNALEALLLKGVTAALRSTLISAMASIGEPALDRLRPRLSTASPALVDDILQINARVSMSATLALCRELLKDASSERKLSAIRVLPRLAKDPDAFALLKSLTGLEGEKTAAQALKVEKSKVQPFTLAAIAALGDCHDAAAISALSALLNSKAMLGDKELDPIRQAAAVSLSKVGAPEALAVLERCANEGKGRSREAAAAALARRA